MEFSSLDDKDEGEYTATGFVEMSKLFAMQDDFFYGMASFTWLYLLA